MRRHRVHYDVIVMVTVFCGLYSTDSYAASFGTSLQRMVHLLSETSNLFLQTPHGAANSDQNGMYSVNDVLYTWKLLSCNRWLSQSYTVEIGGI